MRVRFAERARPRAVEHDRNARRRVVARVGVKRDAGHRHLDAQDLLGVALNCGRDPIRARLRRQRLGQQKLPHLDLDLRIVPGRSRDQLAQFGFDFGVVLLRNHATVDAKDYLIRDHVGVDAALDQSDVQRRRDDACRARAYARERRPMGIKRGENGIACFERVDAGLRHGGMRLLARNGHLEMQTAVMRGDHRIGKAGRDHRVGPHQPLIEQPFRADDTAGFLVIGEVKFERSAELAALYGRCFQREQRPGVAGKIRFRHRHAASVHDRTARAVFDDGTVRIEAPSEAGRHHVPVGIERDDRPVAETMADDEIGHALHARRLDRGARRIMRLDGEIEPLQELARPFRVCRAISRRVVARHLH